MILLFGVIEGKSEEKTGAPIKDGLKRKKTKKKEKRREKAKKRNKKMVSRTIKEKSFRKS